MRKLAVKYQESRRMEVGTLFDVSAPLNLYRAHVFADIKPYICTFAGCNGQFTVFPTRKDWADHEFNNHRCHITFACYECPEQLATQDLFLEHLQQIHSAEVQDPQRSAALIVAAKRVEEHAITEETCPLCQRAGWQLRRAFIKHLGKHMEDIALLALPPADDPDSPKESDQWGEDGEEPFTEPVLPSPAPDVKETPAIDGTARPAPRAYASTKKSPKSGNRLRRKEEDDSDDSGDDDIQPIHFFVPGENINAAVLVEYINRYVDRDAKITSAQHPTVSNYS